MGEWILAPYSCPAIWDPTPTIFSFSVESQKLKIKTESISSFYFSQTPVCATSLPKAQGEHRRETPHCGAYRTLRRIP